MDLHPPGNPERSICLIELSDRLYDRFRREHSLSDLEEAIALSREALELCPVDHPERPSTMYKLARCVLDQFNRQYRASDLEEAITLSRGALELCPPGHPNRSASLHILACCLSERSWKEDGKEDLEEMIVLLREALELHPLGHPDRSWSLHYLAIYLSDRFDKDGRLEDIKEAVNLGYLVLELRPSGHPERHFSLNYLAGYLYRRYYIGHATADLQEAITLAQAALDLRPPGHPVRSASLHALAACFCARFDEGGQMVDLEKAITIGRDTVDLRPPGHPERHSSLNNLACYLYRHYYTRHITADLQEAVALVQSALDLRPPGHPKRPTSLSSLALYLSNLFDESGQIEELERAITFARDAVHLLSPSYPDRDHSLNNLASYLHKRYLKTNRVTDLQEAITLEHVALDLRPPGHPKRSISVQSLDLYLSNYLDKDRQAEDVEDVDLDKAITVHRDIMTLYSSGHPRRIPLLDKLADWLVRRFQQRGDIGDLDELTELYSNLLDESLTDGHARSVSLHGLALGLWCRFQSQGAISNLDEAIGLERAALKLRQQGHSDRTQSLRSLVLFLSARLTKTGKLDDLEELVKLGCRLAEDTNPRQSDHAPSLRRPGPSLQDRLGSSNIEIAIELTQSALEHCSEHHPNRAALQIALRCYQEKVTKPAADFMKSLVQSAIFDILDALPPRLLNTQTGLLCDRDSLAANFENSPQFQQLLSSTAKLDSEEHVRKAVTSYFKYAMLSHRWGRDEPQLREVRGRVIYQLDHTDGIMKLRSFCTIASKHGYLWAWSDTCCIDKYSTVELAKSIASMFSWYRRSSLTIVYLADVYGPGWLSSSVWFERGWTLQELLAPRAVLFYMHDWSLYRECPFGNHKKDSIILCELEDATGIAPEDLTNFNPGMDNARSRLQWASRRRTTEPEDIAYSLFGVFNVYLPVIPGESAENALGRLLGEIISRSEDISVLNWVGKASPFHSCFPTYINSYQSEPYVPSSFPSKKLQLSTSIFASNEARAFVKSLSTSDRPHFIGRQLSLSCIMYEITNVDSQGEDSSTLHIHNIIAEGLEPMELALTHKLQAHSIDRSRRAPLYALVRPWYSKSSDTDDPKVAEELFTMFSQPFSVLLLEKSPRDGYYRRIASSSTIFATPASAAGVMRSKVQTVIIV